MLSFDHPELRTDFLQDIALEREQEEIIGAAEPEIEQAAGATDVVAIERALRQTHEAVNQMRPRPAADVAADEFGGRFVRRDFALADDKRRAEIAEAAEQVHRLAKRVEH